MHIIQERCVLSYQPNEHVPTKQALQRSTQPDQLTIAYKKCKRKISKEQRDEKHIVAYKKHNL